MQRHRHVIVLVSLCCLLGASGRDLDDRDELIHDEALIQGQWQLFSAHSNGKFVGTDHNVISVDGESWKAGNFTFKYHLDSRHEPKQIDWDLNGQTWLGIYKIDGDKLCLCLSTPGNARPQEFVTEAGDGFKLHVRKRVDLLPLK